MHQIVFYVPASHVEVVKDALFAAGAGRVGHYEACSWQVLGEGQFRPGEGSDPFLGKQGELERTPEFRVELVCEDDRLDDALAALRNAHPYEEPAFHAWRVHSA